MGGEAGGDRRLGVRVEGGGRFHQEEHVGLREEGAGQPQPLALAAGDVACLVVEVAVEPVRQGVGDVGGGRRVEGPPDGVVGVVGAAGEGGAQVAREEVGVVVGEEEVAPQGVPVPGGEGGAAPGDPGSAVPGEAFGDGAGLLRAGAGQGGHPARGDGEAGVGVVQLGGVLRRVEAGAGGAGGRGEGEDVGDPAGGDEAAGQVVGALDEGGDGDQQRRDVAVDRHEFADGDGSGGRHPGADPGDDGEEEDEEAGGEGLYPAGEGGDAVAERDECLGAGVVAGGEDPFAAEAVEDAQPRHEVTGERGQLPLLLAVAALGAVQPAEQRADRQGEGGDAEQDDQGEQRGDAEEQDGGDGVGGGRADAGAGDGQGLGDPADVPRLEVGEFPGGDLPGQGGAEAGDMAGDHLHGPVGGVHPDPGHGAVPQDAEDGEGGAGGEQRARPQEQRPGVPAAQTVVDRPGQQVGRGDEQAHPGRAPEGPEQHAATLTGRQPPQEPERSAVVRHARVRVGDPAVVTRAHSWAATIPPLVPRHGSCPRPPSPHAGDHTTSGAFTRPA